MNEEGGGASRSTDPAAGTSSATDVSLREFVTLMVQAEMVRVNERFHFVEMSTEKAFENSQRAIDKADIATEKRFEGVNEFRAALADQATRFVTLDQLRATADKLEATILRNRQDIDTLNDRMNLREGASAGSKVTIGNIVVLVTVSIGAIGVLVVLANYFAGR